MLIPVSSVFIMFTFLAIGETSAFAQPVDFMVTICAVFCWWSICLYLASTNIIRKNHRNIPICSCCSRKNRICPILWNDTFAKWKSKYSDPWYKKHLQSIKLLNEKNDSDKINAYIQQLLESSDLKETSKICDNEMLNAILCRYQRQCNEKHIVFILISEVILFKIFTSTIWHRYSVTYWIMHWNQQITSLILLLSLP